jgi:hypothetical protein
MNAKHRCNRDGSPKEPHLVNPLTWADFGRSRPSLLASVSLITLVALGEPDRALAQCSGLGQTILTPTTGPVLSNGGAITITKSGTVTGSSGVT